MGCRGGGGEGGWRDAAAFTGEQTGSVCFCVCVLGEEGLCQSRWGYILCFMVTRGCINHGFIKRPQSQSTAPPPPPSQRDIPLSLHPSLLCPPSSSALTVSHHLLKTGLPPSSITPPTVSSPVFSLLSHPHYLSLFLSVNHSPLLSPSLLSPRAAIAHRLSLNTRQP